MHDPLLLADWTADLVRGERGVDVAQKVARRIEELVLLSRNLA